MANKLTVLVAGATGMLGSNEEYVYYQYIYAMVSGKGKLELNHIALFNWFPGRAWERVE